MTVQTETTSSERRKAATIKCVVWDLDNTLWDGVLLEDGNVKLRDGVVAVIKALDARGILQSIASKNDHSHAFRQLERFGLAEYFLYPQINWNAKSASLQAIVQALNIGIDTVAFIDDQAFEREEVQYVLPDVLCIDAAALPQILDMPRMIPAFISDESRMRRHMYLSDIARKEAEESFTGPTESFLATLDMRLTIGPAQAEDLRRAEELTLRTNQLNTTGYTYSYEELDMFRCSDDYHLLIADLHDKYGAYGKIGLALIARRPEQWHLKLLLMSCRVMSRGVGTVMMSHIMQQAKHAGVRLMAEFVTNDRNRMMYVTYKFAGFQEVQREGSWSMLEHPLNTITPFPDYISVTITG